MIDGFRVETEALDAHVAEVDALAERVRRAADAAKPLQRDAYGQIGQVFAGMADQASRTAAQGVADLADAVRHHGDGIRNIRDEYVSVDGKIAEQLKVMR